MLNLFSLLQVILPSVSHCGWLLGFGIWTSAGIYPGLSCFFVFLIWINIYIYIICIYAYLYVYIYISYTYLWRAHDMDLGTTAIPPTKMMALPQEVAQEGG